MGALGLKLQGCGKFLSFLVYRSFGGFAVLVLRFGAWPCGFSRVCRRCIKRWKETNQREEDCVIGTVRVAAVKLFRKRVNRLHLAAIMNTNCLVHDSSEPFILTLLPWLQIRS